MADKHEYTFELFAPYNNQANLIADFNDWHEIPMQKSDDGYFRAAVHLADGVYQYRFNIQTKSWFYAEDEWKTVTDPYATEIDGDTQNAVLRLKNGKKIVDEYEWRHMETPLAANNKLVIYEMHVGDFSGGESDPLERGKYTDATAKLDYLERLGVNAVELMPVKESPGDFSWGYSPVHFFATENNYGASFELKEFIDKSHEKGIRVILDGVYNHANPDTPLAQIDHDYWFRRDPLDAEHNWGPEFNYDFYDENLNLSPARKFILDSIRFWLKEYRIDGIRYDGARHFGGYEILKVFVETADETIQGKPFIHIAEHIPQTPEIVKPQGAMDACWNDSFMHTVAGFLSGDEVDLELLKNAIDAKRMGYETAVSVVNYLCNHDQNRLMKRLGENGIFGEEAFRRARLGAAILLTSVGIPMIWMGEEFGEYKEKSTESNKINWSLLENSENKNLFEYYQKLIDLRKTNSGLQTVNISFFHEDAENNVLAFWRFDETGNGAAVVLNLSEKDLENYIVENFPTGENWREWTKNFDVETNENKLTITLEKREALIFIKS